MNAMVAAVSFITVSKASSRDNLLQGFALAVALHIGLLVIQPGFSGLTKDRHPRLSISIQLEKRELENKLAKGLNPEPKTQTSKRAKTSVFPEDVILAKASVEDSGPERKPRIELSTSGVTFKRFMQSETDRNIDFKQNKLSDFSATFDAYFAAPETAPEINYRDFQGRLGGGQYKVHKDGKVTCVLKMMPLSFDDHVYGAGAGSKDCTPIKKFDLNVPKNTRE